MARGSARRRMGWTLAVAGLVLLASCRSSSPVLPGPGTPPGGGERALRPYRALEASDPRERVAGINLLVHTADSRAPERLRPLLDDPVPEVRAAAVNALRLLGGPRETAPVRRLLDDEAAMVRREVLRFLAGHQGASALTELRQAMREDPDPQVQALAILSLGVLDAAGEDLEEVVGRLEGMGAEADPVLRAAHIEYVRRHAPRARDRSAVERLLLSLLQDASPEVRMAAARALGQGDAASAPRAALAEAFEREQEPYARAEALLAHGRLGGRSLAPRCREILESHHHWILQASACSYLGQVGDPAQLGLLERCMLDPRRDPRVRETAASAVGRLPGGAAVLEHALVEGDETARRAAILAYPAAGAPGHVLDLARGLVEDPSGEVRWAALLMRGRLRDVTAYPGIVEGLRGGFGPATDALSALLEITGGDPNHGFRYEDWMNWARQQAR